ncbi:hypothetical protein JW826_02620 [Candidatus Woesearchaeota archaeon]|nr:hypothetical protein [Candidatus Woesearchaeota archaeon]
MNKKGESISMSVIIIAAIALLVLVVLAVLVLRSGTSVGQGTGCAGVGGRCADSSEDCQENEKMDVTKSGPLAKSAGCREGQVCCVQVMRDISDEYE